MEFKTVRAAFYHLQKSHRHRNDWNCWLDVFAYVRNHVLRESAAESEALVEGWNLLQRPGVTEKEVNAFTDGNGEKLIRIVDAYVASLADDRAVSSNRQEG